MNHPMPLRSIKNAQISRQQKNKILTHEKNTEKILGVYELCGVYKAGANY